MKKARKLLALVLSLAVALTMGVAMTGAVFAANTAVPTPDGGFTVTITNAQGDAGTHTYEAYQIFSGTLAKDDNNKLILSDIQWGTGITSAGQTALGNAAAYAKTLTDANAEAKAEQLAGYLSSTTSGTYANGAITGLQPGYYLIQDASTSPTGNKPYAKTKFILQVVGDQTVQAKTGVPTVDKEIAEATPTKVSDYDIGDEIPYTITGTLPVNFDKFNTYKTFTFTDTLCDGLTPPAKADVAVKIGSDDITSLFDVDVTGQVITVSLKSNVDLRTATHGTGNTAFAAGDEIVVSYNAVLNDSAVIGGTGNSNTAKLTFSNDPNFNGNGTEPTGDTPESQTVVFTYTIKALKVEPTSDAAITAEEYAGLTDEQKADYVKINDNEYQKVKALEGAGFTLYKDSKADANKVDEINTGSTFEFTGVDAGTYILSETTVPDGYNAIADITIVVTATYDTTKTPPEIKTLTCTPENFTANITSGEVTGKILNESGAELPSTGGIGTTIFYILGALLIIVCGVVLIARRRMTAK